MNPTLRAGRHDIVHGLRSLRVQWRVSTEDCLKPESTASRVPAQTFKGTVAQGSFGPVAGTVPSRLIAIDSASIGFARLPESRKAEGKTSFVK